MKIRKFYAMEGDVYVNYISLFTEHPMRLEDTPFDYSFKRLTPKRSEQIIYTEREAKRLQQLHKEIILVEINEFD